MFRTFVLAATALIAVAAATPVQAIGVWFPNTTQLNGMTFNGRNMQGAKLNGIGAQEPTGGAVLLAIELSAETR